MSNPIKYKILLADDEPQNLKYLFDALATEDYQIFSAPNGAVAVDQAVKHLPDAIIMDWDMPVLNGFEAVKRIRENSATISIPIIMATGKMTSTENLKMALDAGANDYIRKPFDVIEIIARVKSMIRLNQEYNKNIALQHELAEQEIINLKYLGVPFSKEYCLANTGLNWMCLFISVEISLTSVILFPASIISNWKSSNLHLNICNLNVPIKMYIRSSKGTLFENTPLFCPSSNIGNKFFTIIPSSLRIASLIL